MATSGKQRQLTAAGFILLLMSTPASSGEGVTQLAPCPDTPNCVSSQAGDAGHSIAPLSFQGPPGPALDRLADIVQHMPRTTVTAQQDGYLHAEVRSRVFRFVDDLEFLLDAGQQLIHVRSAARTGYSDLGVNRRRVERIRKAFAGTP